MKVTLKKRNEIILEHIPLIKFLSIKIYNKFPYPFEINELISYGVIGLIDAIKKYKPIHKNKFKTYAEYRIRGAILDAIREYNWVSRHSHEKYSPKIIKISLENLPEICDTGNGPFEILSDKMEGERLLDFLKFLPDFMVSEYFGGKKVN